LVATMFENFMTTFTDGIVSKQDLIRIDRLIHNSNTLESQQIGQKQSLLVTIQKHKAYLLKIYKDF
jgi:flagellar biosynthesis regulator FlbT